MIVEQLPHIKYLDNTYVYYYPYPVICVFILSGHSEAHIPSKVFEFLQLNNLAVHDLTDLPSDELFECPNLYCAAARRCIDSLTHDSNPRATEFALEFLPLILGNSGLSEDLYEACSPETHSTRAYGRLVPTHNVNDAMQSYRHRYEEAQLGDAQS